VGFVNAVACVGLDDDQRKVAGRQLVEQIAATLELEVTEHGDALTLRPNKS